MNFFKLGFIVFIDRRKYGTYTPSLYFSIKCSAQLLSDQCRRLSTLQVYKARGYYLTLPINQHASKYQ